MEKSTSDPENSCGCSCECCQKNSAAEPHPAVDLEGGSWSMRVTDTVGASFLGILAILLLVFLVRSNKRNRELLLEVISLRRQS